MSDKKLILCPYCGNTQTEPEDRCEACGGFFDPLSLKVTQQHMGPWFVRDRNNPFRPGCSYEVLVKQIEKGKVKTTTIIRGPTTRQFWSVARHVPGVSHLLGYCHHCGAHAEPNAGSCGSCGEVFFQPRLRDNLGLAAAGQEVHIQPKLSDSGAFDAIADEPHAIDKPIKLPKPAATTTDIGIAATIASFSDTHARQQQVADEPIGSSILAGLRANSTGPLSQPNTSATSTPFPGAGAQFPAGAVVSSATAQASASRDAMAWMTGSDQTELDSLATAVAGYAPPQRAGISWATWVLIAVNLALLAAGAAVVFIAISRNQPATGTDETSPRDVTPAVSGANDDGMSAHLPQRRERPAETTDDQKNASGGGGATSGGGPTVKLPDVVDSPSDPRTGAPLPTSRVPGIADPSGGRGNNIFTDNNVKPISAAEQARLNWASRFKEGRDAENRGDPDQAMKIYQEIKAKAPSDALPGGLDQAIDRAQTAIKRRNIEKVLGK